MASASDACVWVNGRLATLEAGNSAYGLVPGRGAVAASGGLIRWVGAQSDLPTKWRAARQIDVGGRLVTPALIDCHTHLVYGGNRASEFEQRLEGKTYEEIARVGGGIVSTVRATREASADELLASALPRLDALMAEGVSVVEIKSGYGLDLETEVKMLQVARRLGAERPVHIVTSFLGAHALPAEFAGQPDAYIDDIVARVLPAIAKLGLADAVDGFCETIGFSPGQIARLFGAAKALGLPVKLHAEQLSNLGGAAMAARAGALSADHLEHLDEAGAQAMAKSGTVAVLLPGAFYFLRETTIPPVAALRRHNVPLALATDANPGSSPLTSLLLAMNMGCTLFGLTPHEALAGVTREAARALGLASQRGTISPGKVADLAVWDVESPAELAYKIGFNPLHQMVRAGQEPSQ
ncbi:MAG: imidazolonepropionase [Alphaproteobacteria bacterium]